MQASIRKSDLRTTLRAARKSLSPLQRRRAAERAAHHALRLIRRLRARHIALYTTLGSELDTAPLLAKLRRRQAQVHLPRICGNRMRFMPPLHVRRLDLILLPLLGYDAQGARLGQGGGHYDRALSPCQGSRTPLRVGYAFSVQQMTCLPREAHDIPLHAVITEKGLWRFG